MDVIEVKLHDKIYYCAQKKKKVDALSLFKILSTQSIFPKVFWSHRESSQSFASFGKVFESHTLPQIHIHKTHQGSTFEPHFFGGRSFYSTDSVKAPFNSFSPHYYLLPQWILMQENSETVLIEYAWSTDLHFKWSTHSFDLTSQHPEFSKPLAKKREDVPDYDQWIKNLDYLIQNINQSSLQKVVLARHTQIELSSPLNAYFLLEHLFNTQHNCSVFSFEFEPKTLFLGATPECLFTRNKNKVATEAVAGTSALNENQLLTRNKDLFEFNFVLEFLKRKLSALTETLKENPIKEINTGFLKHIYTHLEGVLKKDVSDEDLLKALHPTPALCGTPSQLALETLKQYEPFDRGWYAAPIGHITSSKTEFIVGIRSCLIHLNKLHLFTGCGIVKDSDPQKEWEELEMKMQPYCNFLDLYAKL